MDSIKEKDRAHDMKPQQDSKHRRSEEAQTDTQGSKESGGKCRSREQTEKARRLQHRGWEAQGRSPESWEAKGKRRNIKKYNSEGKSLS